MSEAGALSAMPFVQAAPAPTTPASSGGLAAGVYTVQTPSGQGTGAYRTPSAQAQQIQRLADGATVLYSGTPLQNYFALVQISVQPSVAAWVSTAYLVPVQSPMAGGPVPRDVPGGPFTGANTPPAGTPGTPPATGGGAPPATNLQVQPSAPSSMPSWLLPAGAAALLGWFFLVEQKKKGGRRR